MMTPPPRLASLALGTVLAAMAGAWPAAAAPAPAPATVIPALARPSAQTPAAVAAWLTRYTSIAPRTVVSVGDEYIVAILSKRARSPAQPGLWNLEIRAEMTDPDSSTANLLRSLSASLEINCTEHSSHFVEVRTFAGPNLTGAEQISHPTEGWVANPSGSYFEDIDKAVCGAPASTVAVHASTVPEGAPTEGASRASVPRGGAERIAASSTPALTAQASPPTLRPAFTADDPPPPAPRARARVAHGGGEAQIIAAPSQALAEAAFAHLRRTQPALIHGLATRVERIERDGKTYYRALVFGFVPPADAASFCRRATAAGQACLTR